MWTSENRGRYDRSKLRYPSDLTDEEWALVAPLIPAAKRGGNKRTVNLREVANGLMYILSTGCQWAAIPKDLPPRSTLHDYFDRWDDDGTLGRLHHALYVACRELAGRDASPSAAIIDSQSVKSAEKGGAALTRRAMTAARRSGARSVMSWSTPKACCSRPSSMQRTFRTARVAFCSWPPCSGCTRFCSSYTLTADNGVGVRRTLMKNVRQRAFICWQAELAFPCWSRKAWHKTLPQWVADPYEGRRNGAGLLLQDRPHAAPGRENDVRAELPDFGGVGPHAIQIIGGPALLDVSGAIRPSHPPQLIAECGNLRSEFHVCSG